MRQTNAIRFHQTGGPDVLRWERIDVGNPGPGEVLLRQTAVGLNFVDTYYRSGLYPTLLPAIPGLEGAGIVEAIGADVIDLSVGQRVAYAMGPLGAYAEYRSYPAERLVPLPDDVSEQQAAAMLLQGMTAEFLIRRAYPVQSGQTVLVYAAAGGVGSIACQWLKHLGASVIGVVGSAEKIDVATANGCDHVIDSSTTDVAATVRELTDGAGVPVVFDGVGRTTQTASLDSLARRGTLVNFGSASGPGAPVDPGALFTRGSLYFTRPSLADYTAHRDELLASAAALFDVVRGGIVQVPIAQTFALRNAHEAHAALEGRQTNGSTVLTI
jgi:NADPH2:quinone reductase